MEDKKRVTILVIIALVLAIAAIALNVMSADEAVPTKTVYKGEVQNAGGEVGVGVAPTLVEDKSAGATQ